MKPLRLCLTPRLALGLLAACLSACSALPTAEQSSIAAPPAFRTSTAASPDAPAPTDKPWPTLFTDATLDSLVATALDNNRTLAQALARIEQARARTTGARGALRPQVGAVLAVNRQDAGASATAPQPATTINPAINTSLEVDLFGRLRAASSEADANLRTSEIDAQAVKAMLAADVVRAYLQLRYADAKLAVYARRYAALRDLIAIAQLRLETGAADVSGLASTQVDLDRLISERAAAEQDRASTELQLATLTAQPQLHIAPATPPALVAAPFADTPATVLRHQPTVQAAESRLAAANAHALAAYAARFPSLTLSTAAGYASSDLRTLLQSSSLTWALNTVLIAPLFDGGQRAAQQTEATAQAREAAARLDAAILQGMEDVEKSLASYEAQDRALHAVGEALNKTQYLEKLSAAQRNAGVVGRQTVLEASLASQSAELNRLDHERARQLAVVDIARALGL